MDYNNLKYFITTNILSSQQARWAKVLSQYDFKITYHLGRTNPANGLSKCLDYKTERIQDSTKEIIPILQNLLRKKEDSFPETTEYHNRTKVPAMQLQSVTIVELQDIVTD